MVRVDPPRVSKVQFQSQVFQRSRFQWLHDHWAKLQFQCSRSQWIMSHQVESRELMVMGECMVMAEFMVRLSSMAMSMSTIESRVKEVRASHTVEQLAKGDMVRPITLDLVRLLMDVVVKVMASMFKGQMDRVVKVKDQGAEQDQQKGQE